MVSLFSASPSEVDPRIACVGVRMTTFAPTYCAIRPLRRGESIGPNDVEKRRAPESSQALLDPPIGMRARRAISSGSPLRSTDLEPVPLILAGDRVAATLERGRLRLVVSGRALEDAVAGESFRLHDPLMRRALRARALAPGQAVLEP
ncbi:MAG: flagella basal body P-ring formation protein FlgA [Gemmatimonadetes bacterium]|nr:flagella basal body P-ring formation protein FlgA [Gemmatimonadota bacterium]